jgi:hypothetical protein
MQVHLQRCYSVAYSATYDEHIDTVQALFSRIKDHNVAINASKFVIASRPSHSVATPSTDGFRYNFELMQTIH